MYKKHSGHILMCFLLHGLFTATLKCDTLTHCQNLTEKVKFKAKIMKNEKTVKPSVF